MPVSIKNKCLEIRNSVSKVIIGKEKEIDLVLTALIAEGHVLLEDMPGSGKTMLAKTLAKSLSLDFGRIQFTPDLLPSDLTGINFYNPGTGEFTFRPGSLFANILLADEINRATPRTQSGLLESMEEKQITIDGETIPLTPPYFVIATQNPVETQGTYPLPEAQLDRFLMKLSLGYPSGSESVDMLKRFIHNDPYNKIKPVCSREELAEMQREAKNIFVHEDLLRYIIKITEATRANDKIQVGVSARGSIGLMRGAQAYAGVSGRDFVIPDDIKYLAPHIFSHRIIGNFSARILNTKDLIKDITDSVDVPSEDWSRQ